MSWIRACSVDDIEDDEGFRIDVVPPIAVFRVDDDYVAVADTCTHDDSSLADGYVDGGQVECAWHFARFCLRTGAVLSPPATTPLASYEVRLDGDDVMVHVPR
ncbi:bifunctional 3-phenylpropionate/cinnamic acid dioxygenase ferredoxin subunit [Nocardioides sp. QY071]|uniref:bifunctional 3-phenylpropionate/cinnamic acid dioxygenase ferredoxin subunit n=1 Tax=Nocardioides sp. QY071 TaxID=3044187 RepID=UPI00249A09B0|nr:bifunctional 3-phenylpropionate/cinnamic acid dioxygenase ferredoxin subunit [Nocardioides sp. QY071]WGY00409.1 bifunctional 3-phenylpropionate/cinnamic acid dioxygenase ferredoxin subunit [Nocardioides sp. QY071]